MLTAMWYPTINTWEYHTENIMRTLVANFTVVGYWNKWYIIILIMNVYVMENILKH